MREIVQARTRRFELEHTFDVECLKALCAFIPQSRTVARREERITPSGSRYAVGNKGSKESSDGKESGGSRGSRGSIGSRGSALGMRDQIDSDGETRLSMEVLQERVMGARHGGGTRSTADTMSSTESPGVSAPMSQERSGTGQPSTLMRRLPPSSHPSADRERENIEHIDIVTNALERMESAGGTSDGNQSAGVNSLADWSMREPEDFGQKEVAVAEREPLVNELDRMARISEGEETFHGFCTESEADDTCGNPVHDGEFVPIGNSRPFRQGDDPSGKRVSGSQTA